MAKVYANLIKHGLKTIDQVPEKIREDVIECLRQDVVDGKITDEEFEQYTGQPYEELRNNLKG